MPDWKRIVREKLGTLPLSNGRPDEVIEELAHQLESAYEEALAEGHGEQEAMRRSMAQFQDWEKLRSQVFQSVEGRHLPVWEQNGFFAPRRLPVWTALALTLVLLAIPSFRQALGVLPVPGSDPTDWGSRVFPEKELRRIERSGDKEKYARALAFVALHSPKEDDLRARDAAEKAIALNRELTWISAKVSHATYSFPGYDPHPWIERLKAWDPENAFPYLLEADANVRWWELPWTKYGATPGGARPALAAESRWRIPMEKAFGAPRLDLYSARQFALDRRVLQDQGFDRPDLLIVGLWSRPMPDLVAVNFYVDFLLNDVGENAKKSGRIDDALAAYRSVARFGERLQSVSHYDWQSLSATKYRNDAYAKMASLLERQGRTERSVELARASAAFSQTPRFSMPNWVAEERAGHIVQLSALLASLLFFATVAWLVALGALRWRPNLSSALDRLASILCAAPVLLLLSSWALFLGYYPYARPIAEYASIEELQESFGPFFMGLYGFPGLAAFTEIYLPRMLWPAIWCALVALVGACSLWLVRRLHAIHPDEA
ncbi:MAG TPA: hypothetical protein VHM93_12625 [Candidatus Acidoferrum sp.]|jgi:hypothetical protein|nr:hypothetical protein [Candidatus Acidoferrum sp.]